MADPALQSVHLDMTRREEFRRARQALFASRGNQTVCLENADRGLAASAQGGSVYGTLPEVGLVAGGQPRPLKVGVNTVGRLPDNDIVVQDAHASRRHCAIVVHTSRMCEVHDMASKNGTYLNGARVTCPTRLKPGDEISVGEFRMIFQAPAESSDDPEASGGQTHRL